MIAIQCKMARVALGIGTRELAALAKVSPDTIARLERGEALKGRTVDAVRSALETAGVEFIPENGGGAGVRLRKVAATTAAVEHQIAALETDLASISLGKEPSPEAPLITDLKGKRKRMGGSKAQR